ncbi:MAG TPA: VWA domain-containing protein, partial [Vicinamibacterales bacterium]|nr:VWA domain-containing protein [Vicinamibacterales bacterium]
RPAGRRRAARCLPAVAAAAMLAAPPALAQRFRTGIELVSLNVTVTDRQQRFVRDLAPEEFEVYEDGVRQEIAFFSRTEMPIALALLLDTSASMEEKLATAQEAAIGFVRRMKADDVAEVVDFDSRVEILQPFTSDRTALEQAIRSTAAGGSTALYHALYVSLRELRKERAQSAADIRRQAIVLLSDGEDTSSILGYEEVLDLAKRSETAIYAIGLRGRENPARGFKESEFVLRQLSQETGGRVFFPRDVSELPDIYRLIADELSSQYTLAYSSRNPRRDGAWRRVVVRVARPDLTARTKQGYYAPAGGTH